MSGILSPTILEFLLIILHNLDNFNGEANISHSEAKFHSPKANFVKKALAEASAFWLPLLDLNQRLPD